MGIVRESLGMKPISAEGPTKVIKPKQYFFESIINNPGDAFSILGKGFVDENVVAMSMANMFKEEKSFPEDKLYSRFTDPQLEKYEGFLHYFEDSKSSEETAHMISKLEREQFNEIYAPLYIVGRITGALTDPTSILMFTKGKKIFDIAAGGKTFMHPTRFGAALTAEEAIKQSINDERSLDEGIAIAGAGFLLPGLINKLNGINNLPITTSMGRYEKYTATADNINSKNAAKLNNSDEVDYRYLDPNEKFGAKSGGASADPKAQPKSYNEDMVGEEIYKTMIGLENSPLTSIFRGLQSKVLSAREMVTELLEIPLYQNKNFKPFNEATTISVENEITRGKSLIITTMRSVEDMYDKYLSRMSKELRKDYGTVSRFMKKVGYSKDGVLSFPEFRREISIALSNGFKHEIDEIVQSARNVRENYYDVIGNRADESGLFLIMPQKQLEFWKGKLDVLKKSGSNTIKIGDEDFSSLRIKKEIDELQSKLDFVSANKGLRKNYLPRFYKKDVIKKNKTQFTKLVFDSLIKKNRNAKYSEAEEIVDEILTQQPFYRIQKWQKIIDSETGYVTNPAGISDHVKARNLDIADELLIKGGFIESDTFGLLRGYYRSIMPDIVLTERFGDPGALGINYGAGGFKPGINQIHKEYTDRIFNAKSKSAKEAIEREMIDVLDDLEANVGLIRGTYGLSANPEGAISRTIRVAKNITAMTYLSGILAAVPDVARLVMADGITKNFGRLYEGFFNDMGWRMLKLSKKDALLAGEAADMYLGTRAALFADTSDMFGLMNTVERTTGQISNFYFSYINGMNLWNTGVKNIASLVNGSKILDYVELLAKGEKIGIKEKAQLANLFIDDVMAKRIYKQYQEHGLGKGAGESAGYKSLRVGRTDNWTDKVARDTYLSALQKDINITIVTPGKGDVPLWMNRELGGVLAQFKKFGMGATQRILMRGLQERDTNFMLGVVGLVSLGAMVDSFRQRQFGRDYSKKKFQDKLISAIDRSAVLGIFTDVNRMVETLSNNRLGLSPMIGAGRKYEPTFKQKMGLAGPTASYIANIYDIMLDWGKGTHDYTTAKAIRKTLPFQNIWYLDNVFDKIEKGLY